MNSLTVFFFSAHCVSYHFSQGLLGKYAGHLLEKQKKIAAIDLYRKANKHTEVASLLTQLARTSAASKVSPLRVKKLYVLAALEITKFRQRALVADMSAATRGVTANGQTGECFSRPSFAHSSR